VTAVAIEGAAALQALLRDNAAAARRPVRLCGHGTRARLLSPAPADALHVSLRQLHAIERLEPDDLTCTVQPGVPCAELAQALAAHRLELGGVDAGDPGTVGGLYAADPLGPPVPGGACPRSTLLGVDAVLAEGLAFRAGARVVKSVAGFDVHRLLVGSRGRVFAATRLHLKLRPAPPTRAAFATPPLDLDEAVERCLALRWLPVPPRRLLLRGTGAGAAIHGCFAGRPAPVRAALRAHDLHEAPAVADGHLAAPAPGRELVVGRVRAIRLLELLRDLPAPAPFVAHAGGHFEVELAPPDADALLQRLPALGARAAVALGARVGLGGDDDQAPAVRQRLLQALDPLGLLR